MKLPDKRVLAGAAILLAAGFWFYVKPNYLDQPAPLPPTADEAAAAPRPTFVVGGHESVIVNLAPAGTVRRYAKIHLALELSEDIRYVGQDAAGVETLNEELHTELDQRLPQMMDAIITVFGRTSAADLLAIEKRDELKRELRTAINSNLAANRQVEELLFVSLLVQ